LGERVHKAVLRVCVSCLIEPCRGLKSRDMAKVKARILSDAAFCLWTDPTPRVHSRITSWARHPPSEWVRIIVFGIFISHLVNSTIIFLWVTCHPIHQTDKLVGTTGGFWGDDSAVLVGGGPVRAGHGAGEGINDVVLVAVISLVKTCKDGTKGRWGVWSWCRALGNYTLGLQPCAIAVQSESGSILLAR